MLAPELGYKIVLQKYNFASVNKLAFIMNKISYGLIFSKTQVVKFNYSREQIEEWGMQTGYNAGMTDAITPSDSYNSLLNI